MSQNLSSEKAGSAMTELQAGWYNELCSSESQLSLDPDHFQLFQATKAVQSTSEWLYRLFDQIPPAQLTNEFNPGTRASYFDEYRKVITSIQDPSTAEAQDRLRKALGDDLEAWTSYKKNHPLSDVSGDTIEQRRLTRFQNWAYDNLAFPEDAVAKFKDTLSGGAITDAKDALRSYDTSPAAYVAGDSSTSLIKQLTAALRHGKSAKISFDSSTQDTSIEHSWAKDDIGEVGFFYAGLESKRAESLTKKAASSKVTVEASFEKCVNFAADPSEEWYDSGALTQAYQTTDETVWPSEGISWEDEFGSDGSFTRCVTNVVAVDGITVTVTSHADYSEDEQRTLEKKAKGGELGIWPLVSLGSHTEKHHYHVTAKGDASIVASASLPLGNPILLGINVDTVENQLTN